MNKGDLITILAKATGTKKEKVSKFTPGKGLKSAVK
jgi:nucleoid DNA-binding protein